ncbi:RraA family protein [Paralcaligenes sp. KSB-10]|uniref:RraA family protein n=1 Tax=Paralcaligenes sp. KSB-10 TaxID=2901142 RepID=UPI001E407204|nr:RraA family protein [Paralcaligenes sp. KSB-10]UHL65656.1 RraA family protein [Paralcaligenes sp. KSB-10]
MEDIQRSFNGVSTSIISDVMDRLPGTNQLKPMHGSTQLIGRALTVKVAAGDNLFIHKALRTVQPGDVLVIDAGGGVDRALIGEIMLAVAKMRGAVGYVVDGAIRDVGAFSKNDFPCFAKGVTHRGPYKNGPGAVNIPVSIDGAVVQPGDIVIGDEDGVVFIPVEKAEEILGLARKKMKLEADTLSGIGRNVYDDSWIEASLLKQG